MVCKNTSDSIYRNNWHNGNLGKDTISVVGTKQHCRISLLFIVVLRQYCDDPTICSVGPDLGPNCLQR